MIDLGIVKPGSTVYVPFATYDSNDPSASVTITGLAVTDIEVYKDGGTTQRASDSGYTLLDTDGIDFDTITGIHGFSIDLADNTTAGFWAAGSQYTVVVASITVDAATINFIPVTFRIGQPAAILNTTIATLASQTSFTLTSGPAEDDALNGMWCIIQDVASAVQMGHAVISDYVGSTLTVTLAAGTTFTAAATDNISIMGLAPLQPTTTGRTLGVDANGRTDVGSWLGTAVTTSATTNKPQVDVASANDDANGASGLATFGADYDSDGHTNTQEVMIQTTIATLATQTSFTLTAGSTDDNAYAGCMILIQDASTAAQRARCVCSAYTGATKTVTLASAPEFTIAATDKIHVVATPKQLPSADAGGAGGLPTDSTGKTSFNDIAATAIVSDGNPINTTAGAVDNVTLVATTTTNTDMRGTDSAALASNYSSARAGYLDNLNIGENVAGTSEITALNNLSSTEVIAALEDSGLALVTTTIATLASQTSFTLTAGSTDDDAYNGCIAVIEDVSTAAQKAVGLVSDYTGATKTVTLAEDPAIFTMAATDNIRILPAPKQLPDAVHGAAGGLPTDSTGKTSFNDITTAQVNTEVDTALSDIGATSARMGYLDELAAANLPADIDQLKADNPGIPTKGVAITAFPFLMVDTSGDPATSKTVTVQVSKDGGAFATIAGSVTEVANGVYECDLSATEMNANTVMLKATATGCDNRYITILTQPT